VRDKLKPGVGKSGRVRRPQDVQSVAERGEHLEIDHFEHWLRGVELQEQNDENAVVGQLLEIIQVHLVVLQQDAGSNAQHLQRKEWGFVNKVVGAPTFQSTPCSAD